MAGPEDSSSSNHNSSHSTDDVVNDQIRDLNPTENDQDFEDLKKHHQVLSDDSVQEGINPDSVNTCTVKHQTVQTVLHAGLSGSEKEEGDSGLNECVQDLQTVRLKEHKATTRHRPLGVVGTMQTPRDDAQSSNLHRGNVSSRGPADVNRKFGCVQKPLDLPRSAERAGDEVNSWVNSGPHYQQHEGDMHFKNEVRLKDLPHSQQTGMAGSGVSSRGFTTHGVTRDVTRRLPQQPTTADDDEDADVFSPEMERPEHMFFLEEDEVDGNDNDNDNDDSEDYDSMAPYADGYHSSQLSTSTSGENPSASDSFGNSLANALRAQFGNNSNNDSNSNMKVHFRSRVKSPPRTIPCSRPFHRASTSPAMAGSGPSPTNSPVFAARAYVGGGCGAIQLSSSCPVAFSRRWSDVGLPAADLMTASFDSQFSNEGVDGDQDADAESTRLEHSGRFRSHTVCSKPDGQQGKNSSRRKSMGYDLSQPTIRSRSYSESDVQRLLMKDLGKELRRISDDFASSRGKPAKLTTVSESASEHDDDIGDEV